VIQRHHIYICPALTTSLISHKHHCNSYSRGSFDFGLFDIRLCLAWHAFEASVVVAVAVHDDDYDDARIEVGWDMDRLCLLTPIPRRSAWMW
jgi:hypothetical protein